MAHTEKKLSSQTIFEGKVITVTHDTVELENGKTAMREMVHHHGGACIAALNDKGEIYLIKQFRYPFGKELWEIPAGKLEKDEDPLCAAKRELEEEVGVRADNFIDLGEIYPTVGYCTEIIYSYAATGLTKTHTHFDEDEFITSIPVKFEKAVDMVLSGEIKDAKTVAAVLKLDAMRKSGKIAF